jgi:GxxExxY protein
MEEYIFKKESYRIIGACMEVHKELGCGFCEPVYQEALYREFLSQEIPFRAEKKITVSYKGDELMKYFIADFVCFDAVIIEVKAVTNIISEHSAQVLNYLKASGLPLGLLINFGSSSLQYKRFIL